MVIFLLLMSVLSVKQEQLSVIGIFLYLVSPLICLCMRGWLMPDITMCSNDECEKRSKCYRYLATPSVPYQSISDFPFDRDTEECDYYIENV